METPFDKILNLDPLLEAEKITGKSYKEDKYTQDLGLALALRQNQEKREELALRGDSYYNMPYDELLKIFSDHGFEEIYSEPWTYQEPNTLNPDYPYVRLEQNKFFWNNGVLARAESYQNKMVNSAKMYFNWMPFEDEDMYSFRFSGHQFELSDGGRAFSGDLDIREGFAHNFGKMSELGIFLEEWKEVPWTEFINYKKSAEVDFERRRYENALVASKFPEHVRRATGELR